MREWIWSLAGGGFSMAFVDFMLPAISLDHCRQYGDWITDGITAWMGHRWSRGHIFGLQRWVNLWNLDLGTLDLDVAGGWRDDPKFYKTLFQLVFRYRMKTTIWR